MDGWFKAWFKVLGTSLAVFVSVYLLGGGFWLAVGILAAITGVVFARSAY